MRKHLVFAFPPPPGADGPVVEVAVDDAYARPAEAQAGKRRAPVESPSSVGGAATRKLEKRHACPGYGLGLGAHSSRGNDPG